MDGYTVDPNILQTYATDLDDRGSKVTSAANRVQQLNGGDINAFGVAVGQVLGIPTRIALGVLHDQVNGAAKAYTDQASNVRTAADQYRSSDTSQSDALKGLGQPL
ncbi:type VII secretion target [Amycolatopsis sp. NPDC051903]|uniref:type VII secretion target n=1 Tax=Amycolatopsis sp. NPDC051903 TaxID=3363936 RepID=UPI003795DF2A